MVNRASEPVCLTGDTRRAMRLFLCVAKRLGIPEIMVTQAGHPSGWPVFSKAGF